MSQRILLAVAVLLAALVLGLAFFWHPEMPERPLPMAAPPAGGDFTLQSAGGPVALQDFRGKLVLVYFGYTYCPDICPTALAATAEGLKLLTPEELARVAVIFISVDPERDTPERLKEYTAYFHPEMLGVTGSAEEIAAVAKAFGAGYIRQPARPDGSYAVDHTTRTYAVAPDGKLAVALELNAPAEKYLETVRGLLR